jgi:uncharacterized protein (TIGR03437 family)
MRKHLRHQLSAILPATLIALIFSVTAAAQTDDCVPERSVKLIVQSTPFPSLPGQTVSFGAFVESVMGIAEPGGEVQLLDGSTDLGSYPLKQSQIHITMIFNEAGAHVITANYSGDFNYCSKMVAYGHAVDRITSPITLTTSAPTSAVGAPVVLTAQLGTAPPAGVAPPSGQIQFVEGTTVLGSAAQVSGKATLTLTNLSAGTHQIVAVLIGDPNWYSVRSAPLTQTVGRASSTTVLTAAYTLTQAGIAPTFTVAVSGLGGVVPGGTVQLVDATTSAVLAAATLPAGSATVIIAPASRLTPDALSHPITAVYSGDGNFAPSTSNPIRIPGLINAAGAESFSFAPDELVSLFSSGLSTGTLQGTTTPLPTSLAGDTVTVTDSAGVARPAGLYLVSPEQINFVIPAATAPGAAQIAVTSGGASLLQIKVTIVPVAPGLFSAGANGKGLAAAQVVRDQVVEGVNAPIRIGADPVFLLLYGTGIRNRSSLAAVTVTIGGRTQTVTYAGAQPNYAGLDQINVLLSSALAGAGQVNVAVTVDGQVSNTVTLNFQ